MGAEAFNLESYMPSGEYAYMRPAWASCLQWCIGDDDMIRNFYENTGCSYQAPRNALDAMIDKETGNDRRFVEQFVKWFNKYVWGPMPKD